MDQGGGTGTLNPDVIAASVKSVVDNYQSQLIEKKRSRTQSDDFAYPVADLFGRCFLRVCLWVDVFTGWTRRRELLAYNPDWKKSRNASQRIPSVPVTAVLEAAETTLVHSDGALASAGTSGSA